MINHHRHHARMQSVAEPFATQLSRTRILTRGLFEEAVICGGDRLTPVRECAIVAGPAGSRGSGLTAQ
jgi:hypothetical protein